MTINQLQTNLKFDFNLFVFDNSSDKNTRNYISIICERKKVNYFELPYHSKIFKYSQSHALAINWVLKNYTKKRNVDYFMFLDHDVFPFRNILFCDLFYPNIITGILNTPAKKTISKEKSTSDSNYRYFWPGFLIFPRIQLNEILSINFMPFETKFYSFDTGGQTYIFLIKNNFKNFKILTSNTSENFYGHNMEIIDSKWLHTFSGSNWRGISLPVNYEENVLSYFIDEK